MKDPTGKISIIFRKRNDGKTCMAKQYFKLPLQIMMPHYYDVDGTAFVYVLNPSGGILQHDRLSTEIVSESGSSALVTTPGNTKLYKMDDGYAEIETLLTVEDGAVLEYLPEHNVPFSMSKTYQENIFRVAGDGVLFASDMVTAGRVSRGELFAYQLYQSRTKIYIDGELQLLDNCRMEPSGGRLQQLGMLEGYQSNGTFYVCAPQIGEELIAELRQIDCKVHLAAGKVTDRLLVVRFLGNNIMDMQAAVLKVWDVCRRHILKKDSVRIRKY